MASDSRAVPINDTRNSKRVARNRVFRLFVKLTLGKYVLLILLILAASVIYLIRHDAATSRIRASKAQTPASHTRTAPDMKNSGLQQHTGARTMTPAAQSSSSSTSASRPSSTVRTAPAKTASPTTITNSVLPPAQPLACPAGQTGTPPNCTPKCDLASLGHLLRCVFSH